MKKFQKFLGCMCVVTTLTILSGCQSAVKSYGGSMTIKLPPGQKLETIDWENDSLWYLTRPMNEDEEPQTHILKQSSEFGIIEGTVTIIESKEE